MRTTILALLIGSITIYASQAMAVDFPTGFYAGAGGGVSSDRDFCAQAGKTNNCEDTDFAWRIYGGYQLLKWVSFEGGYTDLGSSDAKIALVGVADETKSEVEGFTLATALTIPKIGIFGKVGAFFWDKDSTTVPLGFDPVSASETGTSLMFGVGGRYPLTEKFGIGLEWDRYVDVGDNTVGESDMDVYSIDLIWSF